MDRLRGLRGRECGRGYPVSPPDALHEILSTDVTSPPSLSAVDEALVHLTSATGS